MIISRTPYRISFFGGGTDYPVWYQNNGAALLTSTINHYCYIFCRRLAPFFKHKSRIVWSKVEKVLTNEEIEHPSVNAVLKYLDINQGIEIHHQGDLPARSGLGSSSAFTVGLLHAAHALQGIHSNKRQLACEAVHIERDILRENVGVQDQIQTSYGGLNKILVQPNGDFMVSPITLPNGRLDELQKHLILFFTGISRTASDIAAEKIKAIPKKSASLSAMQAMVDEAINILSNEQDITKFGELLHESWQLKRGLSPSISPDFVDDIYARAKEAGAIGGKLLGAGGGGFILFFADPKKHPEILNALSDLLLVPFEFENYGSQIIFNDNMQQFSQVAMSTRNFRHLL